MSLAAASPSQVKAARRLLRRKDRDRLGLFLVDGPQGVREALAEPNRVTRLFVDAGTVDRHCDLLATAGAANVEILLLDAADLSRLTESVTPQGVAAVSRQVDVDLASGLGSAPRLAVCCAEVRDPGNAGTVVRCADAFGADAVVLSAGSVDLYNAKTVRATVGSLFHLPVIVGAEVERVVETVRSAGLQVLAADGDGEIELPDLAAELSRPTLWLFGNEARGLSAAHTDLADRRVRVPLYGAAESLNLSTAAAVCLYASATAQRRA